MYIEELKNNWDSFGKKDPLWAILTDSKKKNGKWDINEFYMTGVKEISSVMEYIDKTGVKIKKDKVLDFGCGIGRLSQAFTEYFDQVVGVDIAQSMIDTANLYNKHKEKCKYFTNVQSDLKMFDNESFSFIYSNIVLQHIKPEYSKIYIKEFIRLLVPNGVLVFQVPYKKNIKNSFKTFIKKIIPGYNYLKYIFKKIIDGEVMEMYCIQKKDVEEIVNNCGGKIIDIVEDDGISAVGFSSYRYCVIKK